MASKFFKMRTTLGGGNGQPAGGPPSGLREVPQAGVCQLAAGQSGRGLPHYKTLRDAKRLKPRGNPKGCKESSRGLSPRNPREPNQNYSTLKWVQPNIEDAPQRKTLQTVRKRLGLRQPPGAFLDRKSVV